MSSHLGLAGAKVNTTTYSHRQHHLVYFTDLINLILSCLCGFQIKSQSSPILTSFLTCKVTSVWWLSPLWPAPSVDDIELIEEQEEIPCGGINYYHWIFLSNLAVPDPSIKYFKVKTKAIFLNLQTEKNRERIYLFFASKCQRSKCAKVILCPDWKCLVRCTITWRFPWFN